MTDRAGRPERIGLFGGTFDPPHCGHVAVAIACVADLALDRLLMMVANDPWMKGSPRSLTPAEDRFAMVEAAVEGLERVSASRMEIDRGGPSYTIDTVRELRDAAQALGAPAPEVFLVVGADLVPQLDAWHRAADLRGLVELVVVNRPGSPAPDLPPGFAGTTLEVAEMAVSSSEVRKLLLSRSPVEGLVPPAVVRFIGQRSLYAVGR